MPPWSYFIYVLLYAIMVHATSHAEALRCVQYLFGTASYIVSPLRRELGVYLLCTLSAGLFATYQTNGAVA